MTHLNHQFMFRDGEDRREFLDRKRDYLYRLSCSIAGWLCAVNLRITDADFNRIGEEWQA